ncbi:MAG: MFS transporter [Clostridia bacterium]|nr:MFS transporter [Clostridia bacterium]MDE7328875.1 MFS transporter [Clostridia bacterium]
MRKSKEKRMTETPTVDSIDSKKKHISTYELVSYVIGTGFYGMFLGMINTYRTDYINNVLFLSRTNQIIMNVSTAIASFLIGFIIMRFIDNFNGKRGKFRPIVLASAVPMAIMGFLMFFTPFSNANSWQAMIYIVAVSIAYNSMLMLANTATSTAIVMTPNEQERNTLFSVNGFVTAVMSSAPLLIILILGFFVYQTDEDGNVVSGYFSKNTMFIIAMAICAICYVIAMVNAMLKVNERVTYVDKKKSKVDGTAEVIKNKNFWFLTLSNAIRDIRLIGSGFGIYVAVALLGSTSKFMLIGLPTALGTLAGMLIVQKLIKKIDVVKVYFIFGVYSLLANILAFGLALAYFKFGGVGLQIAFIGALFLIGFQFGSTNIIPNIFQADVLNDIELQTGGKRLEQTLSFSSSIVTTMLTIISGIATPTILLDVCGYVQGSDVQSESTKIKLVFLYTVFVGIFFALSLIPMIGYRLNKKRRAEITSKLDEMRAARILAEGGSVDGESVPDGLEGNADGIVDGSADEATDNVVDDSVANSVEAQTIDNIEVGEDLLSGKRPNEE